MIPRLGHGLVVGRFLPLQLGHRFAIECAHAQVERLHVVVLAQERDALPVRERVAGIRACRPDARVTSLLVSPAADGTLDLSSLRTHLGHVPEVVFGAGRNARNAARALDARWLPIDPARIAIPRGSAALRGNPDRALAANSKEAARGNGWVDVAPDTTPCLRIALVGAESTGKSTLAGRLARALGGTVVPEHAEVLLTAGVCDRDALRTRDFEDFARGQATMEDTLARLRGGLLWCDSDLLTTRLYAERLIGACPAWIEAESESRSYALTLVSAPGGVWEDAPHRVDRSGVEAFHARLTRELAQSRRAVMVLEGDYESRYQDALAAIQRRCATP